MLQIFKSTYRKILDAIENVTTNFEEVFDQLGAVAKKQKELDKSLEEFSKKLEAFSKILEKASDRENEIMALKGQLFEVHKYNQDLLWNFVDHSFQKPKEEPKKSVAELYMENKAKREAEERERNNSRNNRPANGSKRLPLP